MKQNKVSYSKGICWIDDCRIPSSLFDIETNIKKKPKEKMGMVQDKWETNTLKAIETTYDISKGRFPANILVCDDMLNDGVISKAGEYKGDGSKSGGIWTKSTGKPAGVEYGDKGTNSRYYDIDKWFDKILND